MEELIILLIAYFMGRNKRKRETEGSGQRHHRLEPGTDLEGARPNLDRYGLDHAVPVTVYERGPDETIQPAKRRAGDKRRLIEQRLAAEELARNEAAGLADAQTRRPLAPMFTPSEPEAPAPTDAYTIDGGTGAPPSRYPYGFQSAAKPTHRVLPAPQFKSAVVANTAPIVHKFTAGGQAARRRRRKASAQDVAKLLTSPGSLAQLMKAKVILDPPPALTDRQDEFLR